MIKKVFATILVSVFFSACASTPVAKKGVHKPKSFVTPWEYYQSSRPAVLGPEEEVEVKKTKQVHTMGEDTKSDKTQMIIVGTVVGVVVIGGTVAAILLTR